MEGVEGAETQLLYFAALLPCHERAMCKEMVLDRDARLWSALEAFHTQGDAAAFKAHALGCVIEEIVDHAHRVFQRVFLELDISAAKSIAKEGTKALPEAMQSDPALVYGEIDFFSFATLLEKADPAPGELFVDLGSGTGKAAVAAALLYGHKFSECAGVELLPALYEASLRANDRYEKEDRELRVLYAEERAEVRSYCGDLLAEVQADEEGGLNWVADADVVFVNATCFPNELMDQVAKRAEGLRPGARVITLTRSLESRKFRVMERRQYAMSWGPATAFVHQRFGD